jgi:hypothetical protein
MRDKRKSQPDSTREYVLLYNYGITLAQYRKMWKDRNGLCDVCHLPETQVDKRYGTPLTLAVDHDHACCPGKKTCGTCIRGLLCKRCNQTLGLLNDNRDLLRSMIQYLDVV